MTIHEPGIYHIYNRGNNQQTIFFSEENYLYSFANATDISSLSVRSLPGV